MKIELMTYFKRRDAKFESAYAPPPREVSSSGTILMGAAAVIIGLGISAVGMHKYSQHARLSVLNAEPLAAVALSEGEQFRRPADSSQMAENEAFVISQATIPEISDLINPQSQSVGNNVDRSLHDMPPNRSVLVEPMREEQAALQETEFLDSTVVAALENTGNQRLNNALLITELTAIA